MKLFILISLILCCKLCIGSPIQGDGNTAEHVLNAASTLAKDIQILKGTINEVHNPPISNTELKSHGLQTSDPPKSKIDELQTNRTSIDSIEILNGAENQTFEATENTTTYVAHGKWKKKLKKIRDKVGKVVKKVKDKAGKVAKKVGNVLDILDKTADILNKVGVNTDTGGDVNNNHHRAPYYTTDELPTSKTSRDSTHSLNGTENSKFASTDNTTSDVAHGLRKKLKKIRDKAGKVVKKVKDKAGKVAKKVADKSGNILDILDKTADILNKARDNTNGDGANNNHHRAPYYKTDEFLSPN